MHALSGFAGPTSSFTKGFGICNDERIRQSFNFCLLRFCSLSLEFSYWFDLFPVVYYCRSIQLSDILVAEFGVALAV